MSNNQFVIGGMLLMLLLFTLSACDGKNQDTIETKQINEATAVNKNVVVIPDGNIAVDKLLDPVKNDDVMVLIPAGEFIMGTDDVDASGKSQEFGFNEPLYLPEQPQRKVNLDAYYIDKYEVSNAQFKAYLHGVGLYSDAQIQSVVSRLKMEQDNLPVRSIIWRMASEYCLFVGKRLPTEAEWEKAARGTDGREYPWGNEWNPDYVNAGQGEFDLTPVGSFEAGKSFYGLYDMGGNVMEWTADWFEAYPGAEYKSPNYGQKHRVARGGSWGGVGHYVIPHYFRASYRFNFLPEMALNDVGFRCAKDA
ncbi:MAG: formylglycine-generating enzyme family protein [Gammaproteobacteria bacterium]|nr:formylglycine-generating enzyme family protein [Gammaproteobacteria bacterium]